MMKSIFILFFLCFIVVSCSHPRRQSTESVPANVSVSDSGTILNKALCAGRATLHYAAAGLGGASDIVVVLSSGVLVGTTICSPALLLDSRAGGHSNLTGACVESFLKEVSYPMWGFPIYKWAKSETYPLLCPKNITISNT